MKSCQHSLVFLTLLQRVDVSWDRLNFALVNQNLAPGRAHDNTSPTAPVPSPDVMSGFITTVVQQAPTRSPDSSYSSKPFRPT